MPQAPALRTPGKLATTNITNELARAIGGTVMGAPNGVIARREMAMETLWFKITGPVSGQRGKYTAKIFNLDALSTTSGNLAESDLGTLPSGDNAEAWNPAEIGSSSNSIATGTIAVGRQVDYRQDDGKIVLLIASSSSSSFPVKVTQDGGTSPGIDITYTVKSMNGAITYGTSMTPLRKRAAGQDYIAAANNSYGEGFYNETGSFLLAVAWDEAEDTDSSCATGGG